MFHEGGSTFHGGIKYSTEGVKYATEVSNILQRGLNISLWSPIFHRAG